MNGETVQTHYSEDGMRMYLQEAGREPLLTKEQEVDLAKRMLAGRAARHILKEQEAVEMDESLLGQIERDGERSRERLINANLRLVINYAKKNYRNFIPFRDRIQHGNQGLITAVERFDHTKGYKFSTYAMWWIRQSIQRGAAKESHTVRLPINVQEILKKKKEIEEEALRNDEKLTDIELAKRLDISVSRLHDIEQAPRYIASLDKPIGHDSSDERNIADFVPDESTLNIQEDVVEDIRIKQIMKEATEVLDDRELFVLKSRYGFHHGEPHTLQETGDAMGLTRERVRQIQIQAEKKLREHFANQAETRKAA